MTQFACKEFSALEKELKDDLLECYREAQQEIEEIINSIEDEGFSYEKLDRLFRSLHSMKGNCSVCFLDPLVDALHKLEEIVDGMRGRYIQYHYHLGELINVVIEEVYGLLYQLYQSHGAESALLQLIQHNLDTLYAMDSDESRPEQAALAVKAIHDAIEKRDSGKEDQSASLLTRVDFSDSEQEDIQQFKHLSSRLNRLLGYSPERSERIVKLCHLINAELDGQVDSVQLTAAAYMHDMGMAMVLKAEGNQEALQQAERNHPLVGAQLLSKHEGWEDAVEMVSAHEERFDGSGYPEGLVGPLIPTGSFVIALSANFIDAVWGKSGDEYKKNALRAIQKMNFESGKHFPPNLIEAFNRAIRKVLVAKNK